MLFTNQKFELIDKKVFFKVALKEKIKFFMVYMAHFALEILIY